MTITWQGFNDAERNSPDEARYVVNGRSVGTGEVGFAEVLSQMEHLSRRARVSVYPDSRVFWVVSRPAQSFESLEKRTVPFTVRREDYLRFRRVAKARELVVRCLPDEPRALVGARKADEWAVPDDVLFLFETDGREEQKRCPGPSTSDNRRDGVSWARVFIQPT